MDDAPDRGYSRAPELEDLVSLCRSLNREGVRYVLVGTSRRTGLSAWHEIAVGVMAEACGISYRHAIQSGVERLPVGDIEVPVASKELLIRMKGTVRESDMSDVRFLRLRIEEERRIKGDG